MSIAAIYYTLTLRYTRRNQELQLETRQAQLLKQIHDYYTSEEYKGQAIELYFRWQWKDLEEFTAKYGPETNPEAYKLYSSVVSFYEGVGVLVKRGLIDKTLVDDLMSSSITRIWEKIAPLVAEQRKAWNWPQIAEWFEYLYGQIKEIEIKQHPELKR